MEAGARRPAVEPGQAVEARGRLAVLVESGLCLARARLAGVIGWIASPCAVVEAFEAMVRIGARRAASGSFVAPHGRESVGLSRELEAKLLNANEISSGLGEDRPVATELLSNRRLVGG